MAESKSQVDINDSYLEKYGFHEEEKYTFKTRRGLDAEVVKQISAIKNEPPWMTEFRLRAYESFESKPMPNWGSPVLKDIHFDDIFYYLKPTDEQAGSWEDLPDEIRDTYNRLGIPEAEKKYLAGAGAQYESESVYHNLSKDLAEKGVVFVDTDTALKEQPDLFRQYFGTVIPYADNKFAALNSAVWSGGSFIYVPPGVRIDLPLQAYFRINAKNMGQFERTLIIVDEGAYVHYVEGCFLAGARVRTRQGEKPIEEIQKGDEVLTHLGRWRKVYRTMHRPYTGTVYTIRYFGDSRQALRVTHEHPLLVARRERARTRTRNASFEPEWLAASDVKPGDYLAIPIPQAEAATFDALRAVSVPIGGGQHAQVAREVAPPAQLAEWVRGAWRGDGSYDPGENMFRYAAASSELAYAFRDALLRLGIPASINLQNRAAPRQSIYAVVISSPWNSRFGDTVGCPAPDGQHSGSPFHIDERYMYVPIRSMEIDEAEATVYNFSVEEDESYVCEGVVSHNCTAPIYSSDSLHSAVVEIIVKKGGRCRYSTIQNWSTNVYNLVTKRAVAYQDATMEWVDGNLGCLAEGSTVTTPGGIRPIESLQVGDKVLSYDEREGRLCFRAVTARRFSGFQRVHTVSIGERGLRVTPNHPFYSYLYDEAAPRKLGRYRLGYVRADQLKKAIVPRVSTDPGAAYRLPAEFTRPIPSLSGLARDSSVSTLAAPVDAAAADRAGGRRLGWDAPLTLPDCLEIADVAVSELSAEPAPTWDIEVEGTGNFVSQGFIVHNSKLTMKYPAVYLMEPGAHGEILSIAFAGKGQHQDAGAKIVHAAPNTTSKIVSKSISKDGGRTSYRGLLKVYKGAHGSRSTVNCDALLLDEHSRSDTYPYIEVDEDDVTIGHEASVSKIGEEQLFYAMSRGLSQEEASTMVVSGFIEPLVKELPMEYAVEMNRLIALQMEGTVG